MNLKTRMKRLETKLAPAQKIIVHWRDYEGEAIDIPDHGEEELHYIISWDLNSREKKPLMTQCYD